jgi:hypothetical protein
VWRAEVDPLGRRHLARLCLFLLAVYLLTMAGRMTSGDGETVYQTTRALITQSRLSIDPRPETAAGRGGRFYGKYGLGQSAVQAPFFVAGHALGRIGGALDDRLTRFWVGMTNSFVSVALVAVFWLVCRQVGASPRTATGAGLVLGIGTLVWPYARADFSEPLQAVTLLATFYALIRWRRSRGTGWPWAALAGASAGAAFVTKAASLIVLVPMGGYFAIAWWHRIGGARHLPAQWKRWRGWVQTGRTSAPNASVESVNLVSVRGGVWQVGLPAVAAAVPFIACGLFQAGLNYYRFGSMTEFGYGDEPATGFTTPILLGAQYLLFSTGKGLMFFAPAALLGAAGLVLLGRRYPLEAWIAALTFLFQLAYFSRWWAWHGDWSWGPRYLYVTVPFLMLGWVPFLSAWDSRRYALRMVALGVAGAGVIVSFLGVAIDYGGYYSIVGSQIGRGVDVREARLVPQFSPILGHAWLARSSVYDAVAGWRNGPSARNVRDNPYLAGHPWAASHPDLTPEAPERALGFDFWFAALRDRTTFIEYWSYLVAAWLSLSLLPLGYQLWCTLRSTPAVSISAPAVASRGRVGTVPA